MRLKYLILAFAILTGHWSLGSATWARQWNPSLLDSAQEYLRIEHNLSDQEAIFVIWFAPEHFPEKDENRVVREMAQEFMIIGIVHFSISDLGVWTFENPEEVTVELANAEFLAPLSQESLPPVVTYITELLGEITASGMGRLGEGFKYFIFDGTQLDRCVEGRLWVNYLRERYEYQTPLPGCD
jgi:hypothetical protein